MQTNQTISLAIEESIQFLESVTHFTMAHAECSRQKWDGAWWHMAALYEMGEVRRIPPSAIERAKSLLKTQVWPTFIISPDDLPSNEADKMKMDCCHCELAV